MASSAVYNNVYNHYMTSYAPKGMTRYDTHKKSELRSIYNRIVKLNKESPLFFMDTSKTAQAYAIDMKENARELRNTISSVSDSAENGLLNKKAVTSSNEDVITAKYIGAGSDSDSIPSFEIEVLSLAGSQVNVGNYLPAGGKGLKTDTYSFDIHTGNMEYEFQFNVNADDTNRTLQDKLARLINKAGIGLEASVDEDTEGNTALYIRSAATGLANESSYIFNISDAHTTKHTGAVDYFGINSVEQAAQNARFLLNGEERSAYSNNFTIDKTFEVTLHGISQKGSPSTVGLKTDVDSFTENISHLIRGYNDFLQKAMEYTDSQPRSVRLISEMSGITSIYKNELDSIGLKMQEDGTISMDKGLLQQTAQENDALNRFQPVKNLTNMLIRKTNDISINPMDYVEHKIVAYKNPGKSYPNPYMPSMYSGMMFNSYC